MGIQDTLYSALYQQPVAVAKGVSSYVWSMVEPVKGPAAAAAIQAEKYKPPAVPTPLWKLARAGGPFIRLAGLFGASAVALSAYGAHVFQKKEASEELRTLYETANRFHFLHSLALVAVPLTRRPAVTGTLLVTGMSLFCGTCYYHALTGKDDVQCLTPYGGVLLILGWLAMVL